MIESSVMGSQPPRASLVTDEKLVAQIRGSALLPVRPFVGEYFGPQGIEQLMSRLEPEVRHALEEPIVAGAWYPFHIALDIIDGMVAMMGHPRVLRDFATYNLDFATNMIFRAIFKLGSPEFMVARSDQVWRKYYSRGRMTCASSQGHASVELHGFPLMRANYDRMVQHSIEAVLIKAGAQKCLGRHPRCVLRGDPLCVFEFDWK
jgi:hypothetical protein